VTTSKVGQLFHLSNEGGIGSIGIVSSFFFSRFILIFRPQKF